MVGLTAMTEAEFEEFMEISMRDHARSQVQAGNWPIDQADALVSGLRDQFLPEDMATPDHYFFAIVDRESAATVGGLWYMVAEQDGNRQAFVVDIQVYVDYRRRGYGTQAFQLMEEQVRAMGITTVSLHVFVHNHAARAMYEKLGYVGVGDMMSKELDGTEQ